MEKKASPASSVMTDDDSAYEGAMAATSRLFKPPPTLLERISKYVCGFGFWKKYDADFPEYESNNSCAEPLPQEYQSKRR